jgi:hypothetical protein
MPRAPITSPCAVRRGSTGRSTAAPGYWGRRALTLVAPGQTVALYDMDDTDVVAGSVLAA